MNSPIIIPAKRNRYLLLSLMTLFMVLLSIFCIIFYQTELANNFFAWIFYIFGWIGIVFFGFGLFYFLKQVFTPNLKPLLVVDEKGITDRSSAIAIGFIPWEDIQFIHLQPHLNQTYISVTLVDNEPYLAKMNWFQQQACKTNLKMGFPLINIVLTASKTTPQQVYQTILQDYFDNFLHTN